MQHWGAIELDLQDVGVDVGDTVLMSTRTWRWLRERIVGLLTRPATFVVLGHDTEGHPVTQWVYPNRVQSDLNH